MFFWISRFLATIPMNSGLALFPTLLAYKTHDGSMGRLYIVYLPTAWMVDFYGFHVGKYTSPMDPMKKWNLFVDLEIWRKHRFTSLNAKKINVVRRSVQNHSLKHIPMFSRTGSIAAWESTLWCRSGCFKETTNPDKVAVDEKKLYPFNCYKKGP